MSGSLSLGVSGGGVHCVGDSLLVVQSSWNDSCDSLHDSLVTAYLDCALHHQEGAGEEGEAEEVGGALLLPQLEYSEA